jgi:hypothetical protein
MAEPRKSKDEKDLEKLAKRLLSTPHKPVLNSEIGKPKDRPKKRLRRPVNSEADT